VIEKSVLLPCAPERAFALFTGEASRWWPPQRRHTGDPSSQITLAASGAFFERAADGTTVDLGRVRVWEPPARLVLDFYPGTDPDHPTEVEVAFTPEGDGTRVRVLHGPTAASAAIFGDRAPTFSRSWEQVLAALQVEVRDLPTR
jgi:Activator of Hsp90 ATPase homolog 1-like protein